jgi:hypothetical protein
MSNYKPLIYGLGFVLVIGIFFNLLGGLVDNLDIINDESIISPIIIFVVSYFNAEYPIYWINTGYYIFNVFGHSGFELKFPIFSIFGFDIFGLNEIGGFIANQFIYLTHLPDLISMPIMVLLILALTYGIIKIALP